MSEKTVREVQTPYVIEAKEAIGRDTIIVQEDGEPVAAVVPYQMYQHLLEQAGYKEVPRQEGSPEFERNRTAFYRLLPELLKEHKGEWIGIVNEQPSVFGLSSSAVLDLITEKYGRVPMYIQEIRETPRVYKVPSFKRITRL